jgi:dTDP-4-amino-4,6-dideoxygalactose transaminase
MTITNHPLHRSGRALLTHLQPCYLHLGLRSDSLPVTEAIASRVISLPMFAEITAEQIEYVCDHVKGFGLEAQSEDAHITS